MKIYTTLSALKAVNLLSADKDVRYYLIGVQVTATATATRLTATDGHALGIHQSEQQNEGVDFVEMIIPNDVIKLIKSASKNVDTVVIETADGITGTIGAITGAAVSFKAIDGKFPDVQRVMPQTLSGEPAQFQPYLLERFSKASKLLGSKNGLINVAYNGASTALVKIDATQNFIGLIMPVRPIYDADEGKQIPLWAREQLSTPTSKAA
jgi:DNA polymerase III sliding clamp (beta) subunit (PCNA family)